MWRLVCYPSDFQPPKIKGQWKDVSAEAFMDFLKQYPRTLIPHKNKYDDGCVVSWADYTINPYYEQIVAKCYLFHRDDSAHMSPESISGLYSCRVLINYQDVIDEVESMLSRAESEMEDV